MRPTIAFPTFISISTSRSSEQRRRRRQHEYICIQISSTAPSYMTDFNYACLYLQNNCTMRAHHYYYYSTTITGMDIYAHESLPLSAQLYSWHVFRFCEERKQCDHVLHILIYYFRIDLPSHIIYTMYLHICIAIILVLLEPKENNITHSFP